MPPRSAVTGSNQRLGLSPLSIYLLVSPGQLRRRIRSPCGTVHQASFEPTPSDQCINVNIDTLGAYAGDRHLNERFLGADEPVIVRFLQLVGVRRQLAQTSPFASDSVAGSLVAACNSSITPLTPLSSACLANRSGSGAAGGASFNVFRPPWPAVACNRGSGSDLLEGKVREVRALFGMLHRDGADIPRVIEINLGVLVEVLRLDDAISLKLDVEGVGVLKVLDLHGLNERSKKALCTVSPSASNTTRRYLSSISLTGAQRRIRPSA